MIKPRLTAVLIAHAPIPKTTACMQELRNRSSPATGFTPAIGFCGLCRLKRTIYVCIYITWYDDCIKVVGSLLVRLYVVIGFL